MLDEFAGKIKAVKEAQSDPDFCVVARLEGFIAGWGLDEMLRRADAYHAAGADALLIHSRKTTPDQVLGFAAAWQNRCPLVHRADDLLQHAGRGVRAGRDQHRDLGEPERPRFDRSDAADDAPHLRRSARCRTSKTRSCR